MYFPYLRGKQYELVMLREQAELIGNSGKIIPIIEPVKFNLKPLLNTVDTLARYNVKPIVVLNPEVGDLKKELLASEQLLVDNNFIAGIIISASTSVEQLKLMLEQIKQNEIAIIHKTVSNGKVFAQYINGVSNISHHIFASVQQDKMYQLYFPYGIKILLQDGFLKKEKNADYPENDFFTTLHKTFQLEGVQGFGDYLMVGEKYSEGGGAAYAVTIHMTYLNAEEDDKIYIKHYVSNDVNNDFGAVGEKFLQALTKLIKDHQKNPIFQPNTYSELESIFNAKLFRGLGYIKKLSMQNHIEMIANFFESPNV